MGKFTVAEDLAKAALKGAARRKTVPLIADRGLENFAPDVASSIERAASTNNGQSTVVYIKPSLIRQELGIPREYDSPIEKIKYLQQKKDFAIEKGLNLQAEPTADGAMSFTGIDNPDLLRFFEESGDEAVPVIMNVKGGIPEQMPAYTARNLQRLQYPHLNRGVVSGAKVKPEAIKVPADVEAVDNTGYLNQSSDPKEFATRADDVLSRDVVSTVKGVWYMNEATGSKLSTSISTAFKLANKMQAAGASTKDIWKATADVFRKAGDSRFSGVTTGFPDGKPRVEYVSKDFRISKEGLDTLAASGPANVKTSTFSRFTEGKGRQDIIDSMPAVNNGLRPLRIGTDPDLSAESGSAGYFSSYEFQIFLKREVEEGRILKGFPNMGFPTGPLESGQQMSKEVSTFFQVFIHELNHAIDSMNGFARGGNWGELEPEKFADAQHFVNESISGMEQYTSKATSKTLKKHGFKLIGDGGESIASLVRRDASVDDVLERVDYGVSNEFEDPVEQAAVDWNKFKKDYRNNPEFVQLMDLEGYQDTVEQIHKEAMRRYQNIYGEESANLAMYRTANYADVEALRGMEPSTQMAGKHRQRNKLATDAPTQYEDPSKIKRIDTPESRDLMEATKGPVTRRAKE